MDNKEEYHDPDYPEQPVVVKEEPQEESQGDKLLKIKQIIQREFSNELQVREDEVMQIEQRLTSSRRLLHKLRYAIVSAYYNEHKLKMTNGQIDDEIAAQKDPRSRAEIASLLHESQKRIHPSVKKLLGKETVDIEEIFKSRAPRNKARKDYSAMLQKRNYTIRADATKTLRPEPAETQDNESQLPQELQDPCTSKPKKIPRHIEPKVTNVVTLDEATRNKTKQRYRIVIGNTSKYAPAASTLDRSTHKWLLYIRGPPNAPDLRPILTSVTVTLHHSYAPHHTVHLTKPPFHISRRGWGEFPAKVELHFTWPDRNRPAHVTHDIKLDRNYTGLQVLGAETIVDVWLYSTPEMLQYQYTENDNNIESIQTDTTFEQIEPKQEPVDESENEINENDGNNTWLDFFNKDISLNVDEMIIKPKKETEVDKMDIKKEIEWSNSIESDIPNELLKKPTSPKKRIVKYLDPTTGKVYYLEMDRKLDLSTVQEIVINNKSTKISPVKSNGLKSFRKGVSLLKPEVKSLLKSDKSDIKKYLMHIENDHCYLASPSKVLLVQDSVCSDSYDNLCTTVCKLNSVRAAVNYLVKKIPLISDQAKNPEFVRYFPFVVDSLDRFWKFDFSKRRNIEWSRAKLINKILTDHFIHPEPIWGTKRILIYTRLHGFYPTRSETYIKQEIDWSNWHDEQMKETNIKEYYSPKDINTLSKFDSSEATLTDINLIDSEDEIDVLCDEKKVKSAVRKDSDDNCTVLPVEREEDRLRFVYLERKCADIGVELRNEDVGNGYSYSAVHAVMLSAVKSFAEELIRSALAAKLSQDNNALPLPTVWAGSSSWKTSLALEHVYAGLENPRLHVLTNKDTATDKKNTYAI